MSSAAVTQAVSTLAQDLGSSFSVSAVQDLAGALSGMHARNTARLRDIAAVIGAQADESTIESLGWVVTLKEGARLLSADGYRPQGVPA